MLNEDSVNRQMIIEYQVTNLESGEVEFYQWAFRPPAGSEITDLKSLEGMKLYHKFKLVPVSVQAIEIHENIDEYIERVDNDALARWNEKYSGGFEN